MQNMAEVLKEALRNEVKAAAFYYKAAEITSDDESRSLFLELSGMEDDHAGALAEKAAQDSAFEGFDAAEYLKNLEATMSSTIDDKEHGILASGDMKAVFALAIGIENSARDAYLSLVKSAQSDAVRTLCKELAEEEEAHARQLTQALNNLDMDEEDRPGL